MISISFLTGHVSLIRLCYFCYTVLHTYFHVPIDLSMYLHTYFCMPYWSIDMLVVANKGDMWDTSSSVLCHHRHHTQWNDTSRLPVQMTMEDSTGRNIALLPGSSLKMCKRFQVNDTVMLDLETGKVKDFIKFDIGQLCMATGGHNRGRVGTIVHKEKHKGSFDIVLVRDSAGQEFATRYPLFFSISPHS